MLSDHACLHTIVKSTTKYVRKALNLKRTNWLLYKKLLSQQNWDLPPLTSIIEIESVVNTITKNLNNALNDSTHQSTSQVKLRK
jgi:hypothetical protein